MPSKKKALQTASIAHSRVLEPEPPADVWEQLEELATAHGITPIVEPGPDDVWAAEWARRTGASVSTASIALRTLHKAGKIEYIGRGLNNAKYYRIKK